MREVLVVCRTRQPAGIAGWTDERRICVILQP